MFIKFYKIIISIIKYSRKVGKHRERTTFLSDALRTDRFCPLEFIIMFGDQVFMGVINVK